MAREDVTDEVIVVLDAAGAGVVTVRGLRPTGDDQVVGEAAVQSEGRMSGPLQGGDGERLAGDGAPFVSGLRRGEERCDRGSGGVGGSRRSADPRDLGGRLAPASIGEEARVDDELDADGAKPVGETDGEALGHERPPEPEALDHLDGEPGADLVGIDALADERVGREGLARDQLDPGVDGRDPVALDAPDDRHAPPTRLGVDERIDDRDRHVVTQVRRALRVADDQHVRHAPAL